MQLWAMERGLGDFPRNLIKRGHQVGTARWGEELKQ